MPNVELIYVAIAIGIGVVLYRYFSGHGGVKVSRAALGTLPPEGQIQVRRYQVRWRSAEDGSFVAGWQLESGHIVAMSVTFADAEAMADPEDKEDSDLGQLELKVDRRILARNVGWTDQIRDRALRSDTEAILKALEREAKGGKSERRRMDAARPVGDDRIIEGQSERTE